MEVNYIRRINAICCADELQEELDILLPQLDDDNSNACTIELNQRIIKVRSRMVEVLQAEEDIDTTLEDDNTHYTEDDDPPVRYVEP